MLLNSKTEVIDGKLVKVKESASNIMMDEGLEKGSLPRPQLEGLYQEILEDLNRVRTNSGSSDVLMKKLKAIKEQIEALDKLDDINYNQSASFAPAPDDRAAGEKGMNIRINSNTVSLSKESSEYKELESLMNKVASAHGIDNVEAIQIHLSQDKGLVGFKVADVDFSQAQIGGTTTGEKVDGEDAPMDASGNSSGPNNTATDPVEGEKKDPQQGGKTESGQ